MRPKIYHFTAEEVAEMRHQYEDKVELTIIGEQHGIKRVSAYSVLYKHFRRYDPSFETHAQRNKKVHRWCGYCGDSFPPDFPRRRTYCDKLECQESARRKKSRNYCACGKRGYAEEGKQYRCADCADKEIHTRVATTRRVIQYMAIGGYNNKQIASATKLSVSRVKFYRSQLKLPSQAKGWRPEQEAYWKAKVLEAGSLKAVWERSGLTQVAFECRLRRTGFSISRERRAYAQT